MKKLLLIAAITMTAVSACFAQGPTGTTQMVNEEFGIIAQELELEQLQMHHLSKILEKKAKEIIPLKNQIKALKERGEHINANDAKAKAYIENEVSNIRARIKQLTSEADEAITEHLNEEQTAKYYDEVKPKIEEKRKASADRANASKKQ